MPNSTTAATQRPSASAGLPDAAEIRLRHFDLDICQWLRENKIPFEIRDPQDGLTVPGRRAHDWVGDCILAVPPQHAVMTRLRWSHR